MPTVKWDASGLSGVAVEINAGAVKLGEAARDLVDETATDIERDWRKNATETAGAHGKHYPKSIKKHMLADGLTAEIEPTEGMRQGGMSFEFGSSQQSPHLDGQRALDSNEPKFARRVAALRFLE
jgi:hypothetical protein